MQTLAPTQRFDVVRAAGARLRDEMRIGHVGARHGDHVGRAGFDQPRGARHVEYAAHHQDAAARADHRLRPLTGRGEEALAEIRGHRRRGDVLGEVAAGGKIVEIEQAAGMKPLQLAEELVFGDARAERETFLD